jgi:toxin ParE1/3/4
VKIIVHPAGDDSVFYSEQANRQLGLALITEFEKAASLVSGNPELGTPWVSGTRRFVLRRFPFNIVYHLFIIAIAHQKRRPGYWHLRK